MSSIDEEGGDTEGGDAGGGDVRGAKEASDWLKDISI